MSIEAMKQALDFLEWFAGDDHSIRPKHKAPEIAAALRQAIAEAEKQEAVAWMWKDGTLTSDPDFADGTWTPLFAAPVHASDMSEKHVHESDKDRHKSYDPMERNADYERGFIDGRADQMKSSVDRAVNRMAQREWVGLTDEDIDLYAFDIGVTDNKAPAWLVTYARGIEAKLKEKNT
jgi:hypothetical protein